MTPLIPYKKPYKDGRSLAIKLIYEDLDVPSLLDAQHIIEAISYFRLKAYFIPFKINNNHKNKFIKGTKLSDIISLYKFDLELRSLFFKYIARIEIFIRSSLDQEMTKYTNNPFWYLDSNVFAESKKASVVNTVLDIRKYFSKSKEEFSIHYRNKYVNDYSPLFNELPPGWVTIEIMTYGQIKTLMDSLSDGVQSVVYPKIFNKFDIHNVDTFKNWVDVLHGVRNVCAHHSRFFNRNFPAPTAIKKKLSPKVDLVKTLNKDGKTSGDQLNRLYSVMAVVQHLNKTILTECDLGKDVKKLIDTFNVKPSILRSMGFPENWEQEPLFFK